MMKLSSLSKARLLNALSLAGAGWLAGLLFIWQTGPAAFLVVAVIAAMQALSFCQLRRVEREIVRMTGTLKGLARGNFETRLTHITEQGALGEFQWHLNDMADAIDAFVREATAAMDQVSRNRYFRRILEAGMQGNLLNGAVIINQATRNTESKMNGFVGVASDLDCTLTAVMQQINATARNLTDSMNIVQKSVMATHAEISAALQSSDNASTSVQAISAAAEEMSSCIAEITQQMTRTSSVAAMANNKSQEARELLGKLSDMIGKIGNIVVLIRGISSETNLLALNAAIESARAGEAGKGFAVVAGEVKKLAAQTTKATEEIETLVSNIRMANEGVTQAFSAMDEVICDMNEASTVVAAALEEQSAASREIAANAERAAKDTHNVAGNVQGIGQNMTGVDQAASSAQKPTEELSQAVVMSVQCLLDKMGRFVTEIKKTA